MVQKALISELTWRSLEMQRAAFPAMPHYVIPDELPYLLRPTTRKEKDEVHVVSLAVMADNEKEFIEIICAIRATKATIYAKEENIVISPSAIWPGRVMKAWKDARRAGVQKIGGRISAENRQKKSADGVAKIKDRWGMDSKTWPTRVLLKEADISYNTAKTLLPPRPIAQHNYAGKNKRQIKAVVLDPKPREKPDFCGVYVFQIEDDVFKIGSSINAQTRLKQVSAYQRKRMKVVALFNMDIEKAQALECEVHYRLRKYAHNEYNGREIFKTDLNTINRAVKRAMKYLFTVPKEPV